jgi:DNA-binding CsgD family transcriptional regulator
VEGWEVLRKKRVESICYDCLIRLAFEGLSTAIILTDEKCRLIFVNRAAHDVFGVSPSYVGRPIQQVLSDFSLLALWSEACQRDEPVMGLVKVTEPKERLLRVMVGICRTRRGNLIGRALLACDVTEDRRVALEVTEELARTLLGRKSLSFDGQGQNLDVLTVMEWRILKLLGKGMSNKEIADELTISLNTLRTHLKNIYRKLNLPNRSAAVAFAAQLHQRLPEVTIALLGE